MAVTAGPDPSTPLRDREQAFSFPFSHHRIPDGLPLHHVVRKLDHMVHLGRENALCGAEIGPHGSLGQGKRAMWCGN